MFLICNVSLLYSCRHILTTKTKSSTLFQHYLLSELSTTFEIEFKYWKYEKECLRKIQNIRVCICFLGKVGDSCATVANLCVNLINAPCTGGTCTCLNGYTQSTESECVGEFGFTFLTLNYYFPFVFKKSKCMYMYMDWEYSFYSSEINECGSSPCKFGATCINGIAKFTCTCATGYNGTQCEISKITHKFGLLSDSP